MKAFDVANNPGETTINFTVIGPEEGEIENIIAAPNPMGDFTGFSFEHSFINQQVEFIINIYSIEGQLIKTISSNEVTDSSVNSSLIWDGTDNYGSRVPNGIYPYQVKITSPTLNISKESSFEKVVVIN